VADVVFLTFPLAICSFSFFRALTPEDLFLI